MERAALREYCNATECYILAAVAMARPEEKIIARKRRALLAIRRLQSLAIDAQKCLCKNLNSRKSFHIAHLPFTITHSH